MTSAELLLRSKYRGCDIFKSIYIIGFGNPQVVKVGVSREPLKRMRLVASLLGVKFERDCWTYVSSTQRDPYLIERRCHKALSKYRCGGIGPKKLFPEEIFKCDLNKATSVLEGIINDYEIDHPRFNRANLVMGIHPKKRRENRHRNGIERERIARENLRLAVKTNNKSVDEISSNIGVSPRTIEAWMSGVRVVPDRIIEQIEGNSAAW